MAQTLEKLFLTKIATMPKEEIDEGTPGKDLDSLSGYFLSFNSYNVSHSTVTYPFKMEYG